jgi:hypothetical protein
MDIVELHERLILAFQQRAWEAFSALIHPEVVFNTTTSPEVEYSGPEGLREWWQRVADALVFQPTVGEVFPLSERAAFFGGRLQASIDAGGIADIPASWVMLSKDGLAWRSRPVSSREEAVEFARAHGALEAPGKTA